MKMNFLRVLIASVALGLNSHAYANFSMSPSGSTTAFAVDAANQGTSLCAAASTECPASVPINTAGAPLFTSSAPGLITLTGTNSITANAGTNLNTSALATSTLQTSGGQKTQIVDGSGNVIASTSNNLDVQCANCSGSGVSTGDEASFTGGTSLFAGGGGFFQTTATNNALTTGQQGMFQVTANRALFVNPRNSAGVEIVPATAALQGTNTATTAHTCSVAGFSELGCLGQIDDDVKATGSVNPGSQASWGIGPTGSPVVANSVYMGVNIGGTLTGLVTGPAPAASSLPTVQPVLNHASTTAITATSLAVKASAGNLDGFNCTGITGGAAGYCVAYNATSAPGTGALTGALVLDSCYFDATARGCSLAHVNGSIAFSTGIVILMTSAASPFTYTTGTDTGFISGDYD